MIRKILNDGRQAFSKSPGCRFFLETLTSWEKNPRRRQALPFPAGFPQRVFKDPHSFKN
jgi:hypothetical protein